MFDTIEQIMDFSEFQVMNRLYQYYQKQFTMEQYLIQEDAKENINKWLDDKKENSNAFVRGIDWLIKAIPRLIRMIIRVIAKLFSKDKKKKIDEKGKQAENCLRDGQPKTEEEKEKLKQVIEEMVKSNQNESETIGQTEKKHIKHLHLSDMDRVKVIYSAYIDFKIEVPKIFMNENSKTSLRKLDEYLKEYETYILEKPMDETMIKYRVKDAKRINSNINDLITGFGIDSLETDTFNLVKTGITNARNIATSMYDELNPLQEKVQEFYRATQHFINDNGIYLNKKNQVDEIIRKNRCYDKSDDDYNRKYKNSENVIKNKYKKEKRTIPMDRRDFMKFSNLDPFVTNAESGIMKRGLENIFGYMYESYSKIYATILNINDAIKLIDQQYDDIIKSYDLVERYLTGNDYVDHFKLGDTHRYIDRGDHQSSKIRANFSTNIPSERWIDLAGFGSGGQNDLAYDNTFRHIGRDGYYNVGQYRDADNHVHRIAPSDIEFNGARGLREMTTRKFKSDKKLPPPKK